MANTDTQLLLRLSADVSRFQKQMSRIMDAGEAAAVGVEERFRASNRRMAQTAEQSGQAIAKEMDRLRAKYDPLFAASKRYEAELGELSRAHKVGALSTQQHEAALERLNAEFARSTGNGRKMAAAGQDVKRSMSGMGGGIQNVAYQIGDFATQVGAGTSASMALGQQLPQMLGGFGVMGAVLGAVVAVAVPLGAALLSTGDASETLEEQITELRSSVDDYVSAVQNAALPTAEIAEKYGAATEAAREFVRALRDVSEANAREAANAALDRVARQFGGFDDVQRGPQQMNQGWTELTETIEEMSKALGITKAQAEALAPAFERLDETEGAKERTEAAEALLDALEDALGPAKEMTKEQRAVYENIALSADEMARFVGASDGASAGISAAASEAARLADELGRAVENAIELAAQGISDATRARIEYEYRDDWRGRTAALANERFSAQSDLPADADSTIKNVVEGERREFVRAAVEAEEYRQRLIAWRKEQAKSGRSGRSGSGSRSGGRKAKEVEPLFAQSDKELQQIERNIEMIGKTSAEVAELQARYELLDEAKKRGLDLDAQQAASGETLRQQIERQAQAVGDLTAQYDQASERAQFFEGLQDQLTSGFIDAIVEGENLAGTLENLAKSLAKAALQAALFGSGPMAGMMGTAEGGGLFGAITGGRAAGGTVRAGGVYQINEHGKELFAPAVGGRILSAQQTKDAMAASAGGGSVTVKQGDVNINNYGAKVSTRRNAAGGLDIDVMIERKFEEFIESGGADGAMSRSFGLKGRPRS